MSEENKQYKDKKNEYGNNGNSENINSLNEDFFNNFDNESNMEDADEDLLALLDMISAQDYNMPYEDDLLSVHPSEVNEEAYVQNTINDSDDIIALDDNEYISEEESVDNMGDEGDIDNLLDSILETNMSKAAERLYEEEVTNNDDFNDVGGIFSNVLSAVDLLDDKTEAEFAKLTQNFENQKQEETQEKLNFFQKIFGKKKKGIISAESKNKDKNEAKSKVKQEKNAVVKKSKAKNKKTAKATSGTLNAYEEETLDSEKSNEPQGKKVKKKSEKKKKIKKKPEPKVKSTKKAKDIVNEIADDIEEYKVSKLVIIFACTFVILCSGFVILGTNAYSYNLNMKNARTNFDRGRYTEAYYEICGLDVRKQDQETYDKIMTVMYINKEVNSYHNYMSMKKYPEALDSLLKGLERYDKYLDDAKELGIKKNLDSLKASILEELATTFGVTAKEAKKLNTIEDQTQYSVDVISTALENVDKVASE